MKRICIILSLTLILITVSSCQKSYDPESILRNTSFEQYYTLENFSNQNIGYIVSKLAKDSFISFGNNTEKLWSEDWSINDDIQWYDKITSAYDFNSKTEDIICVTLSSGFNYNPSTGMLTITNNKKSISCVFSIKKSSHEVTPIIYFASSNDELNEEISVDEPSDVINSFLILIKYSINDLEYIKNNVSGIEIQN